MNNLLQILEQRFYKNHSLYADITWAEVEKCLDEKILEKLQYMEDTLGEVALVSVTDTQFIFMDTSLKTPNRLSLCYDQQARLQRKKFPPSSSVEEEVKKHQVELLDEEDYYLLQSKFVVDTTSSSWIYTPKAIRDLSGALFCDRRFNKVFTYHNKADSYYASRGFRAKVIVERK